MAESMVVAPKAEPKSEPKPEPKKSVSVSDVMGGAKTKSAPAKPKAKKAKHKHTHIEHHDNGTHTVRHSGAGDEVSYAAPDMDGVHDGLEQHIGDPNASMGQDPAAGGAPEPEAQPVVPQAAGPQPPQAV
jgi:hypothetical protein